MAEAVALAEVGTPLMVTHKDPILDSACRSSGQ